MTRIPRSSMGSPYFPKESHSYDSSPMSSYCLTPSSSSCCERSPSSDQSTSGLGSCNSFLDLEGEEDMMEWDANKVTDIFGCNFPSPIRDEKHRCCDASPNPSKESEPIFWPFDDDSYALQTDFLRLSPPQSSGGKIALSHSDPKHLEHHHHLLIHSKNQPQEMDCRRRLVFEPTQKKHPKTNTSGEWQKNDDTHRYLLELKVNGCNNSFGLDGEVSVEAMVGLSEFDGREGIVADSTEYWSSLD